MKKISKASTEGKKGRKVLSGPVREKARTMDKLVASVGKVIQKKGYVGLNIANISKEAGLDRRLVYTYFGGLDNLVETYIKQKDYWNTDAQKDIQALLEDEGVDNGKRVAVSLLQGQFDAVLKDKALQKLIHWELGEKNKVLRKISDEREQLGEDLFNHYDPVFGQTDIDIRAVLALQIGGLYYLSLHAKTNGSLFCGIDINDPDGKERISKTLEKIVELCYREAE